MQQNFSNIDDRDYTENGSILKKLIRKKKWNLFWKEKANFFHESAFFSHFYEKKNKRSSYLVHSTNLSIKIHKNMHCKRAQF